MQLKFKTVLAILPILPSTALAGCYRGRPAWTDLATEEQLFNSFRRSCEQIKGKHSHGVSTCFPANLDKVKGGSYFTRIEPYAKGEYTLSVDQCLTIVGAVHSMCDHGGVKNISAMGQPTKVALEPQPGCCGC